MNNDVIRFWFSLVSCCIISDKLFLWIFGDLWTEATATVELYDWLWHLCFLVLARNMLWLLYYPWHHLFLINRHRWRLSKRLIKYRLLLSARWTQLWTLSAYVRLCLKNSMHSSESRRCRFRISLNSWCCH